MLKKLTSSTNTHLFSALAASSLLMCSCDSSSSLSNEAGLSGNGRGDQTSEISGLGVDPDFQSIVNRFVIEANKRNVNVDLAGLDIQYGDTDDAYGVCSHFGDDTRDIVISPDLRNATEDFVSEIVLHELGHCILGREHSSNPNSIMHATRIIGEPWRKEVLDELFYY